MFGEDFEDGGVDLIEGFEEGEAGFEAFEEGRDFFAELVGGGDVGVGDGD